MVQAGAEAGIFNKLEPEPLKNGLAPQHWTLTAYRIEDIISINRIP
jgi:hypothetical protein